MDIVIPTCGRAETQPTHMALRAAGIFHYMVVQDHEKELYRKYSSPTCTIMVLPDLIRSIAPTRDWIIANVGGGDKLVMLDDDLTFFARREDASEKFRDLQPGELKSLFAEVDAALAHTAHVGVANREGGNRQTEPRLFNTRILRLLGYRRDVLNKHQINFNVMAVMEDFHVALSLLKLGYRNVVVNGYCHNQAGSGAVGGCSTFRTPQLQDEMARYLASLHEPFVNVVTKETKTSFGGGERTDVTIQWKRAYQYGVATFGARVLDPVP